MQFIIWLIIGGIAGAVAGRLMSGHGYGVVVDVILGIVGGFVGGFLLSLVGLAGSGIIWTFVTALIGASILVAIIHLLSHQSIRTT
jgi:uncharacterized membrane protein YeaQ/YmgE (transglycosylase-associated protein family)